MHPTGVVIMEATPPQKVMKYMLLDQPPSPASLIARTLKRYCTRGLSAIGDCSDVPLTNWSIKKSSWSAGLTTMRYEDAPATGNHVNTGRTWSTQPCGPVSTGAVPGAAQVAVRVKNQISEKGPP